MPENLVSSLISSGLAALVGAVVGGWITYWTLAQDRRATIKMSAYQSYLQEAVRVLTITQKEGGLEKEDVLGFGAAGAVLTIYGSEQVQCRAFNFERSLMDNAGEAKRKYEELAETIRVEVLREKSTLEKCTWPPRAQ